MDHVTHTSLPAPTVHAWTASDGWVLRTLDFKPATHTRGVVILGHAMMVDGRTVCREDRPTIAATLVAQGFRVLVPDLRGHGMSGPLASEGGTWSYDDIVGDLDIYVTRARALAPGVPLALVGHSLFGNAALAWASSRPEADVDAIALLCVDIWSRAREPRWWRWWLKRWVFEASALLVRFWGYLPASRVGFGTADESAVYWKQFARWIRHGVWDSEDGGRDYLAGVASIRAPMLHVLTVGDRLFATPECAERLTRDVPDRRLWIVGRGWAGPTRISLVPDHMSMVTDPRFHEIWSEVGRWLHDALGVRRQDR